MNAPTMELFIFMPLSSMALAWLVTAVLHKTPLPSYDAVGVWVSLILVANCLLTLVWPVGPALEAATWPLWLWLGIGVGTWHAMIFIRL